MDHRAANPLANEVSRAFLPPCTRWDVSRTGGSSRTSTLWESVGTLATNSVTTEASRVPTEKSLEIQWMLKRKILRMHTIRPSLPIF
jgi:hypothetical protein